MESTDTSEGVPTEIRLQILECLLELCREDRSSTAAYASVCKTWQEIIEPKHFASISLTAERVNEFGRVVIGRRRKLVTHIKLEIVYRPTRLWYAPWGRPLTTDDMLRCGHNFVFTIRTILLWLSTWKKEEDLSSRGLTLELWSPWHDPKRPDEVPGPTEHPIPPPMLAEADVVTTLLHRHNDFFETRPKALRQFMESLPALERIVYEQREWPPLIGAERCFDITIGYLPDSLKQLIIFEDYKDEFSSMHQPWSICDAKIHAERRLSHAINAAKASRQLQHLALSFLVDAGQFFHFFKNGTKPKAIWAWPELETLALTAQVLRGPREASWPISDLLEVVSRAVRRMPKLRTLEMWNGNSNNHGCVFRYDYNPEGRRASITWHASWTTVISERAVSSWTDTVHQMTGLRLEFRYEEMVFSKPLRTYSVSRFLKLRDRVITPSMMC